jgi:hypothetical protein
VCGAVSGIVVLDVDGPEGEASLNGHKVPPAPMVRTPHGRHVYFRHPGRPVPPKVGLLPHVDVRGDGSYVVAPPSQLPDGEYVWVPGPGLDALTYPPDWMLAEPKPAAAGPPAERIPAGGRNHALASMAGSMRRRGLSATAIQAALAVENEARCDPPLSGAEVATIATSVGRYEPAPERRMLRTLTVREMAEELERRGRIGFLIRGLWPADAYGALGAQTRRGRRGRWLTSACPSSQGRGG